MGAKEHGAERNAVTLASVESMDRPSRRIGSARLRRAAIENFAAVVNRSIEAGTPFPLMESLVSISAAVQGTELSVLDEVEVRFDALAVALATSDILHISLGLFVGEGSFVGNRLDYNDPANSMIDRVLENRRGIPISLSVVLMEVARRCGVDVVGIGMPGHFLAALAPEEGGDPELFIDPFNAGRLMTAAGCEDLFHSLVGSGHRFDRRFLAPVSTSAIVERTLNNLKAVFMQRDDVDSLWVVMTLRSCLPGLERAERDEFRRMMGPLN